MRYPKVVFSASTACILCALLTVFSGTALAGEASAVDQCRLGDTYRRAQKYDEAEKAYNEALALAKEDVEKARILELLSIVAQRQGDRVKVLDYLRQAQAASKANPSMYGSLTQRIVEELIKDKKLDEAEKAARDGMARDGAMQDRLTLWNQICIISQQKKSLPVLEKECKVSSKEKASLEKLLMLKNVYHTKGDASKENDVTQRIVKEFPDYEIARLELADSLIKSGKPEQALPLLESLASVPGPGRARYAEQLASQYLKLGKEKESAKWLQILKRPPLTTYHRVIAILVEAKRFDLALAEYEEAIPIADSAEEVCELRMGRAKALEALGTTAEAVREYKIVDGTKGCPDQVREQVKKALERLKDNASGIGTTAQ